MPRLSCLIALVLAAISVPAFAENRLGIWPGMSADDIAATLKARCPDMEIEGGGEKFITCRIGEGANATIITATVSSKGRAYYISWSEPSGDEVISYVKRIAGELGLSGAGRDCKFYDYELRCWQARDGSVLYSGERDSKQRYVSYILNDAIKEEDEGPAVSAPVNQEE